MQRRKAAELYESDALEKREDEGAAKVAARVVEITARAPQAAHLRTSLAVVRYSVDAAIE